MNRWASRVLHFALPIEAGDRVMILGTVPAALRTSLEKAKAEVVEAEPGAEPDEPQAADFAIVPAHLSGSFDTLCTTLTRCVRRDGSILIVTHHAGHPVVTTRRRSPLGWTGGAARRTLNARGFTNVQTYGIPNKAHTPQILVPLDHPGIVHWYATSGFQPSSFRGIMLSRVLRWLPAALVGRLLFPSIAVTARRRASGEAGPAC
ncbi:hypothetical protein [Arthrobacter pigmenti]